MLTYKQRIDEFINKRYKNLLRVATELCSMNYNHKLNQQEDIQYDVLAELVIYLYANEVKLNKFIEQGEDNLESFCVMWLRNQLYWDTSPFSKKYGVKAMDPKRIKEGSYRMNEDLVSEFQSDLETVYTDEQVDRILDIYSAYSNLDLPSRNIFDMYYKEQLSLSKIASRMQLPKSTIWLMVTDLNNKIKTMIKNK